MNTGGAPLNNDPVRSWLNLRFSLVLVLKTACDFAPICTVACALRAQNPRDSSVLAYPVPSDYARQLLMSCMAASNQS